MNFVQKHVLYVIGTAAVGGVIGYFIGKKITEGKFEENSVIEEEERYIYEKDDGSVIISNSRIDKPVWTPSPFDISDKPSDDKIKWSDLVEYKDSLRLYIPEEEDKSNEDPENLRTQGETEYESDEPYLVTEDVFFSSDEDANEIIQLTFYEDDDVLVDSFGDIVLNREEVVGTEFEENFGFGSSDPNVCYVLNGRTKRRYEIVLERGSYEMEILGATEEQYKNARKFFELGDA